MKRNKVKSTRKLTDMHSHELISRSIDLSTGPVAVTGLSQLIAGHYIWNFTPVNGTPPSHGLLVKQ